MLASLQKMGDFAKNPGLALCGTADHDGIGACALQHLARLLRAGDVAVGHHRNTQCSLHSCNRVVFSVALVPLFAGAAVHRDHLHTSVLCGQGNRQGVFMALTPAGAHLERDWDVGRSAGLHHRINDGQRQRFVLHERGSGPFVADLLGRAAHVDVNDLRATVHVEARGLRHHRGVGARDLHRNRARLAVVVGAARGLECVPQIRAGSHHLADRIACTQPFAQLAKRAVRHTGHGRDKQIVV